MKTLVMVLGLVVTSAVPAAALPVGDTLGPPATALLLGTGLALAAGARAVRRWTRATSPGR
jgi:hypothetical protein